MVQFTGGRRLAVVCSRNPGALVVQDRTTLFVDGMMWSWGGVVVEGSERRKMVPLPVPEALPPLRAVPYRVFPDRTRPAWGFAPAAKGEAELKYEPKL